MRRPRPAAACDACSHYVGDEEFCFTYGDGVSTIDIEELIALPPRAGRARDRHGRAAARALRRARRSTTDRVRGFEEKPHGDGGWINGGFFVLSPEVGRLHRAATQTVWEREPMERLAGEGQLAPYHYDGFWHPMDTLRDKKLPRGAVGIGRRAVEEVGVSRASGTAAGAAHGAHRVQGKLARACGSRSLGAEVTGYSLAPPTEPVAVRAGARRERDRRRRSTRDVRDRAALERAVAAHRPEIVIHMAAQSLVRRSYADPVETYETNVMGTVNVLEAARPRGERRAS